MSDSYSIYISAHAHREAGTKTGTYVIPPGVNLYVYTADNTLLRGDHAAVIQKWLTAGSLDIEKAKSKASRVYKQFELIPNYIASGALPADLAFKKKTGIYYVGSDRDSPPAYHLRYKDSYTLSDIIGNFRAVDRRLCDVFWLCCRGAPQNSNNNDIRAKGLFTLLSQPKLSGAGLSPSEVKKRGGKWR